MPKIAYREKKLQSKALDIIAKANEIIEEYQRDGFELTLRQLYYQFVSRDLIENSQRSYKALGETINDGRLCGLIDWEAIVDRTRNIRSLPHWSSPKEIVDACARQFRLDKWRDQPNYVEVWIEKDALIGVIEGVCNELDVPHFSCRGYVSQSEMWDAAQRLKRRSRAGQDPVVIHLGDHDPSGIDMTRDIRERLHEFGTTHIDVRRIALTMEQVEEFNPPPNFAKTTDARYNDYVTAYGEDSWELDALDVHEIVRLVKNEVVSLRDHDLWSQAIEREYEGREAIAKIAKKL